MPPKSSKLLQEELRYESLGNNETLQNLAPQTQDDGPVRIREIPCLNDFVALLLFRIQTNIVMPDKKQYRNEGMVVGVGPGLADGSGNRVKSQLNIGDVVLFKDQNIVLELESDKPPYNGHKVVIISERSLICKLPPVPFILDNVRD